MTDERKSTATSSGFHFLSTYQSCRWRWYLHHVRHIIPLKTSRFLLFGQAFHHAKECFYLEHPEVLDREEFVKRGLDKLMELKPQYEHLDQYEDDVDKMKLMARLWWDTFAADEFNRYELLAIEREMLIPLPGGFTMTVRPDAVVRDRESGLVLAFETKTTSRSVSEMARSVACQKQADAQILGMINGLGLVHGEIAGVVPDIVYARQSVKRAERTAPIKRSVKELADSQLSFSGLFAEIGQKVQAVEAGDFPPEMLFDRNGAWCAQFGCEYESVCNSRFTGAPPGFALEVVE